MHTAALQAAVITALPILTSRFLKRDNNACGLDSHNSSIICGTSSSCYTNKGYSACETTTFTLHPSSNITVGPFSALSTSQTITPVTSSFSLANSTTSSLAIVSSTFSSTSFSHANSTTSSSLIASSTSSSTSSSWTNISPKNSSSTKSPSTTSSQNFPVRTISSTNSTWTTHSLTNSSSTTSTSTTSSLTSFSTKFSPSTSSVLTSSSSTSSPLASPENLTTGSASAIVTNLQSSETSKTQSVSIDTTTSSSQSALISSAAHSNFTLSSTGWTFTQESSRIAQSTATSDDHSYPQSTGTSITPLAKSTGTVSLEFLPSQLGAAVPELQPTSAGISYSQLINSGVPTTLLTTGFSSTLFNNGKTDSAQPTGTGAPSPSPSTNIAQISPPPYSVIVIPSTLIVLFAIIGAAIGNRRKWIYQVYKHFTGSPQSQVTLTASPSTHNALADDVPFRDIETPPPPYSPYQPSWADQELIADPLPRGNIQWTALEVMSQAYPTGDRWRHRST